MPTRGDAAMRWARRHPALALVALLILATSVAPVEASTVVWASGPARHSEAVVGPAYVDPYFWDPYLDPGFGLGVTYSYGSSQDGSDGSDVQAPPRGAVPIELHVNPRKAALVVDGTSAGQARDFSSRAYPLWLPAETHDLELSCKGYHTLRVRFEAERGSAYRIHYDLRAGAGLDPRSSGEIQRQ